MKRGIAVFVLWLVVALGFAANFEIQNYDTHIRVLTTGHLKVTERINVLFTASQRGIFRTIPYRYSNPSGRDRKLILSNIGVTDGDGNRLTTKISNDGTSISIRIGDADTYLPVGTEKQYVIQYEVYGAINRIESDGSWEPSAELYWNAIGSEWTATIWAAQATVEFPTAFANGHLRCRVIEGRYGSVGGGYLDTIGSTTTSGAQSVMQLTASSFLVERNAPIQPGSALTLLIGMPDAMIAYPTLAQTIQYEWSPYFGFLIPVVTLIVMPVLWLIFGRDSTRRGKETVMSPPGNVPGHVIGAVYDGRVDKQDISALLVSLAIKGKVTFDSSKGAKSTNILVIPNATNLDLDPAETKMLDLLQKAGPKVTQTELRTEIAPEMQSVRKLIMEEAVALGYYGAEPNQVYVTWGWMGSLFVFALGMLAYVTEPMREPIVPIIGTVLGIFIAWQFAKHMPKVTRRGAEARAQARNFGEWMAQASAREDWRDYLTRNPNMFEDFLPHAIALGRDLLWIRSWIGIRHNAPGWWVTPSGMTDFSDMGDIFSTVSNTVSTSATTPPRPVSASSGSSGFSSSSGGGGFSGGGFGGGGGGSW